MKWLIPSLFFFFCGCSQEVENVHHHMVNNQTMEILTSSNGDIQPISSKQCDWVIIQGSTFEVTTCINVFLNSKTGVMSFERID